MENKDIIVFAGTTEGRLLCRWLLEGGYQVSACVATGYGECMLRDQAGLTIYTGRLDEEELSAFLRGHRPALVLDATHPYAVRITKYLKEACDGLGIRCLRVLREKEKTIQIPENLSYYSYDTLEEASRFLEKQRGRILVTTGCQELLELSQSGIETKRLIARVLPSEQSLLCCTRAGLAPGQIIGMQGPFSTELNLALIRQYEISFLLTKESGAAGGFQEKLQAALQAGISVVAVRRPAESVGFTLEEIKERAEELLGKEEENGV
ncbi:precorrin-6A reductase [Anaerolentibacter hominis]|uniref:precorrin-6A reductase n=1 Tax=Anaerolentibacter hominis TaxID=3079009 RepID=UPI0031B879DF